MDRLPTLRYASLVGLYLFLVVGAANEHHKTVGFQSNPDRRGTLNIIENCLFTILACTWTIQHPNVPARKDGKFETFLRRCKWTVLNILAPEFTLAQSIDHRIWAYESVKRLRDKGINVVEEDNWLRSVFRCFRRRKKSADADEEAGRRSSVKLTVRHCYYGNMGGFVLQPDLSGLDTRAQALREVKFAEYPVTIDELVEYLRVESKDSSMPGQDGEPVDKIGVSEEDIMDKDKADIFTRVIALLQITWLVFTVSTRKARHLATTQLEVLTLAFAACAFLTYCCRWDKPQNVKIAKGIPVLFERDLRDIQHPLRFYDIMRHGSQNTEKRGLRLKNDIIRPKQTPPFDMLSLLIIAMVPVGCVHLLAWNFVFPTTAERIMWRSASLVSIAVPVMLLLLIWIIPVAFARVFNRRYNGDLVTHDARQFVLACISAMENYDAKESEKSGETPFSHVCERLNESDSDELHYRAIFNEPESRLAKEHLERLKEFIKEDEQETYSALYRDFYHEFSRLVSIIQPPDEPSDQSEKKGLWKYLSPSIDPDADRTNLFPRFVTKKSQSQKIQGVLLRYLSPTICIIYAVSRFIVIALAFSSFRKMPDSVYDTAWTRYIPIVQ